MVVWRKVLELKSWNSWCWRLSKLKVSEHPQCKNFKYTGTVSIEWLEKELFPMKENICSNSDVCHAERDNTCHCPNYFSWGFDGLTHMKKGMKSSLKLQINQVQLQQSMRKTLSHKYLSFCCILLKRSASAGGKCSGWVRGSMLQGLWRW